MPGKADIAFPSQVKYIFNIERIQLQKGYVPQSLGKRCTILKHS
jgi:hypothetical protein